MGGDAARAYTLSRRTNDTSEAVASVAVDRLFGILSLAILAGLGATVWQTPVTLPVGLDRLFGVLSLAVLASVGVITWGTSTDALPAEAIWIAALAVGAACTSVFWADRVLGRLVPTAWHESRLGIELIGLAEALSRYRNRRPALAGVFILSVLVQLLRVSQAYLLGLGLGIDVGLGYYLVFMPVGLLMLLLPVSIAGFGLPQGAIVWLLRPQGVPDSLSFALSTLIILTGLAGNLPGAWLYARSKRQ